MVLYLSFLHESIMSLNTSGFHLYLDIILTCFFIRLSAFFSLITNIACITAGTQKKKINMKFKIAWTGLPTSNTATGGRNIANKYNI